MKTTSIIQICVHIFRNGSTGKTLVYDNLVSRCPPAPPSYSPWRCFRHWYWGEAWDRLLLCPEALSNFYISLASRGGHPGHLTNHTPFQGLSVASCLHHKKHY
ncbi:hypothetical protein E2C01_020841 [Portunus trituberculatus]|uniref:Uncharacterized protein n=1 Tax=Portunus trituberculatus TaxID=210409 RepID=A0A5B7E356_PORTR|nr:hypothetical protein [Portunus trituberculatus]